MKSSEKLGVTVTATGAGMPLAMAEVGRRVRVLSVRGGRACQARLACMGVLPGKDIEVVRRTPDGPLVVAVKESRLVLGRGMAHRIMVA